MCGAVNPFDAMEPVAMMLAPCATRPSSNVDFTALSYGAIIIGGGGM
jgi:hypothetical protein